MTRHLVPLTFEHIREGIPGNTMQCPAALALKSPRHHQPRFRNIQVGFRTTTLAHEPFSPTDVYTHTQILTDWIRQYEDSNKTGSRQCLPPPSMLIVDTQTATIDLIPKSRPTAPQPDRTGNPQK